MKTAPATFIQRVAKLPSLPSIYHELVEAVEDPNAPMDQISRIVAKDQSLAFCLLRLANSAFYGIPFQVGTIEEAVQLIGLREIKDLVLANCAVRAFKGWPVGKVDALAFWRHSIACGVASAMLAEKWHDPAPERLFVGGLLHEIGRLTLFLGAPEESAGILARCEQTDDLASRVETEVLGFDHAALGGELISRWRLPAPLREMVTFHHDPGRSHLALSDAFTVHYADFIVSVLGYGSSGEPMVEPLIVPDHWRLGLLDESEQQEVVRELETRCSQMFPILTGDDHE